MRKFFLVVTFMTSLICAEAATPRIQVYPTCTPVQGGVWSRLAYPLPSAVYPQPEKLVLPSPNGQYQLVVTRAKGSLAPQKGSIRYHGLYVPVYTTLRIMSNDKRLPITPPAWFRNLTWEDKTFLNPNYVRSAGEGDEFMWAPDSKKFAASENYSLTNGFPNAPKAGSWRVSVYLIDSGHARQVFVDREAAEDYQKLNACHVWPDMGALKWVGSDKLLLLAQGWADPANQGCKNHSVWFKKQWVLGYLVAVPSGKILRIYTQQQLTRWKRILGSGIYSDEGPKGQPYLQGHC